MPPNQSRSTGTLRMALINCCGLVFSLASPMSVRACGDSVISLRLRENTPPPAEISALS